MELHNSDTKEENSNNSKSRESRHIKYIMLYQSKNKKQERPLPKEILLYFFDCYYYNRTTNIIELGHHNQTAR